MDTHILRRLERLSVLSRFVLLSLILGPFAGCADVAEQQQREFHTSGNREADQRAEQRVAHVQQLRGEALSSKDAGKSLFDRLGGEAGLTAIVNDFVDRVLADPRVNWRRKDIRRGGVLGIGGESAEWNASTHNITRLKEHIAQFIALASGGPADYGGLNIRQVHAGMRISNVEFDAAVGDLKASLDNLGIAVPEQRELLAIVESTRPQIVEVR